MANEITTQQTSLSGSTLYAVLDGAASPNLGLRWNNSTSAFEAVAAADWAAYAVPLVESTGTGFFAGNLPTALAAGTPLAATILSRAGATPAPTDPVKGAGPLGVTPANVVERNGNPFSDFDGTATAVSANSITLSAADYGAALPVGSLAGTPILLGGVLAICGTRNGLVVALPNGWDGTTPAAGGYYFPIGVLPQAGSGSGNSGPITLPAGSITSATFALGTANPAATGILERLQMLTELEFPPPGGSVTFPASGNGSRVLKGPGGVPVATQPVTSDGTTQTLGVAT